MFVYNSYIGTDARIVHVRTILSRWKRRRGGFISDKTYVILDSSTFIRRSLSKNGNLLQFSPPTHKHSAHIIPRQMAAGQLSLLQKCIRPRQRCTKLVLHVRAHPVYLPSEDAMIFFVYYRCCEFQPTFDCRFAKSDAAVCPVQRYRQ